MKKKNLWILIGIVAIIILAAGGYALYYKPNTTTNTQNQSTPINNAVVQTKTDPTVGNYLADLSGRTLYIFGGDSAGVSNCTSTCLATWPAYTDQGATTGLPSGFSTIKRSDNGQVQYTYNGMPLYYFASDENGQVTGNGVSNFQVAKPVAAATTAPASSSQPSTGNPSSSPSYY